MAVLPLVMELVGDANHHMCRHWCSTGGSGRYCISLKSPPPLRHASEHRQFTSCARSAIITPRVQARGPGDGVRTRNLPISSRVLCPVELRRGSDAIAGIWPWALAKVVRTPKRAPPPAFPLGRFRLRLGHLLMCRILATPYSAARPNSPEVSASGFSPLC